MFRSVLWQSFFQFLLVTRTWTGNLSGKASLVHWNALPNFCTSRYFRIIFCFTPKSSFGLRTKVTTSAPTVETDTFRMERKCQKRNTSTNPDDRFPSTDFLFQAVTENPSILGSQHLRNNAINGTSQQMTK